VKIPPIIRTLEGLGLRSDTMNPRRRREWRAEQLAVIEEQQTKPEVEKVAEPVAPIAEKEEAVEEIVEEPPKESIIASAEETVEPVEEPTEEVAAPKKKAGRPKKS
jgi:hypothetical protein